EWAVAELDRLEKSDLPERGQVERFHRELADVVRRYLEARFNLQAPRQTTAEFLTGLRGSGVLSTEAKDLVGSLLERCDLAKFARADFSAPDCRKSAQSARRLVEQCQGRAARSSNELNSCDHSRSPPV